MTSAPAIGFEYRPSRAFESVLGAMTLLALAALWLSALPWWGCLMASLALGGAGMFERRRWRLGTVSAALWATDGHWTLRAGSEDVPASLLSFRIGGGCLWLRLQPMSGRPVSLLLAPDNGDADLRRRLRMRLAATRMETPLDPR